MLLASREDMLGGCDNLLQEIMETEDRWFTGLDSCLWKRDRKHFISSLFFMRGGMFLHCLVGRE